MNRSEAAFVGRESELSQLLLAWDDASCGHGRLVMLVGEPGIGKTRLAEELQERVAAKGATVCWGRCREESGAPPFWPWVQIVRSYTATQAPEKLRTELGYGAAEVCRLVPDVGQILPDIEMTTVQNPEQARFRLFDSLTTFLKVASLSQPLLLILDNLHWADPSSLSLLEFLTPELTDSRLLILGTYRDIEVSYSHSLFHTLGDLSRQRLFLRIPLRGLNLEEVRQLAEQIGGVKPSDGLVTMILQQTGGNPLFVGEMIRLLAREDMLAVETLDDLEKWDYRLPEGIREVIGRRLAGLSDECRDMLTLASVVGHEFRLDLMAALCDSSEDEVLRLAEEALARGILGESPSGISDYMFTHTLIQQTLAMGISAARRARLHARIGDTLEILHAAEIEEHAAELAYHFSEAGANKASGYCRLAGERALATYAYEEAVDHFTRALSTSDTEVTGAERAGLLHGLGMAEAATLKHDDAVEHLRRAFQLFIDLGEVDRAVEVVSVVFTGKRLLEGVVSIVRQALDMIPQDSVQFGHLLTAYGRYLGLEGGDPEGAVRACKKAAEIAEAHVDKRLELRALVVMSNVMVERPIMGERSDSIRRSLELINGVQSPWDESLLHNIAANAMVEAGDLARAEGHARKALAAAERLRDRERLSTAWMTQMFIAHCKGEWDEARRCCDRGLDAWPYDSRTLGRRVVIESELGEFEEAEVYLERLLDVVNRPQLGAPSPERSAAAATAWISRESGKTDRLSFAKSLALAEARLPFAPWHCTWGLALIAVLERDMEAAIQQYEAYLELPEPSRVWSGNLLALLASVAGRIDEAVGRFEAALTYYRAGGFRPLLARTSCDYSETLLLRSGPDDRERALAHLNEAKALAAELGMKPLFVKAANLLAEAESGASKRMRYPSGLTPREVEVLRLLAGGNSNREIAERLVLSVRTVERHITNLYRKIHATGRADATSYAISRMLLNR